MISVTQIIFIIALIMLIIGMINPKLTFPQIEKNRTAIFKFFMKILIITLIVMFFFIGGEMIGYLHLVFIYVILAPLVMLIYGLIHPKKVYVLGKKKNRFKVFIQYTALTLIVMLIFGGIMDSKGLLILEEEILNGYHEEYTDLGLLSLKYEGDYKDGLYSGYGREEMNFAWIKMEYEGEFKEGIRHGYGTFIDRAGTTYEGNWNNDEPNGDFVITMKNGDTYKGGMVGFKRNGYGVNIERGEKMEGQWVDDELVE